jgi:hypothetical protein
VTRRGVDDGWSAAASLWMEKEVLFGDERCVEFEVTCEKTRARMIAKKKLQNRVFGMRPVTKMPSSETRREVRQHREEMLGTTGSRTICCHLFFDVREISIVKDERSMVNDRGPHRSSAMGLVCRGR